MHSNPTNSVVFGDFLLSEPEVLVPANVLEEIDGVEETETVSIQMAATTDGEEDELSDLTSNNSSIAESYASVDEETPKSDDEMIKSKVNVHKTVSLFRFVNQKQSKN